MKPELIQVSNPHAAKLDDMRKKMSKVSKRKRVYSRQEMVEKLIDMQGGLK